MKTETLGQAEACQSDYYPPNPAIARNILSYLGHLPRELRENGTTAGANLAIQIGNLLAWTHHYIAPHEPKIERPLDLHPDSIWSLAKQLQEVGRELWNRPSQLCKLEQRVRNLEDCWQEKLREQESRADELARETLEFLRSRKGGKK